MLLKSCYLLICLSFMMTLLADGQTWPYSYVEKSNRLDDEWYLVYTSSSKFMNANEARKACDANNLVLAEVRTKYEYEKLNQLFCKSQYKTYQTWIDLKWTGLAGIYKWSSGMLLNANLELPEGQSTIDEFFCPKINCGDSCARGTVIQLRCMSSTAKVFCSYENQLQRYALCRKSN